MNDISKLEIKLTENGIYSNATIIKEMLPEQLKPYSYIVTEENYSDAKKDRSSLNKFHKELQKKRKDFEEVELAEWRKCKGILMEIEKIIKESSDALGNGISDIDNNNKLKKYNEVKEKCADMLLSLPFEIDFNKLYNHEEYDKKTYSVKKVVEEIQERVNKINQSWHMLMNLLPEDEVEAEQVKMVFIDTFDLISAKRKADELSELRKFAQNKKVAEQEIQKDTTIIVKTIELKGTSEFFEELDRLMLKHNASSLELL